MRICIDKEISLNFFDHEDIEILNKLSFYFSEKDGIITILGQKVDLSEDKIEDFLDILSWSGLIVILERYSKGRYTLKTE